MTEYNKYDLEDLVQATIEQRPSEFQSAFNSLLTDRIQNTIQDKKIEMAQSIYPASFETKEEE
jgi:hypothetical protein